MTTLPDDLAGLRMLREKEVSLLAGVALPTLRNWRSDPKKRDRGPRYYKINSSIRYRLADVLEWLENSRVRPAR